MIFEGFEATDVAGSAGYLRTRVAHRLAQDHADKVERLMLLKEAFQFFKPLIYFNSRTHHGYEYR